MKTGKLQLPVANILKVLVKLEELLELYPSCKFIYGTWKTMRPSCYLASGNKSEIGKQVLLALYPLVVAAQEIFRSHWPDLYKVYSEFPLHPNERVGVWPQAQFLKNISSDWHKDNCNWNSGIQISLVFGYFTGGSLELETGQIVQFSGRAELCNYFIFNPWEVRHRALPSTGTRYALQLFAHTAVVNAIQIKK